MDKKKKRRIIVLVVCLVLVVGIVACAVIFGGNDERGVQFDHVNNDTMVYNPFIENEERSDNSLLAYGKVLSKYGDKYAKYSGEDIFITPYADLHGISFTYTDGETVTVYCDDGKISDIGYKGKTYTYESVQNGEQKFATAEFISCVEAKIAAITFEKDYAYTYFEDISTGRDANGFTNAVLAKDRYTEKNGVIAADPGAVSASGEKITFIYKVSVPETALYSLQLEYFLPENRANSALLGLQVNGKLPFYEASNMELKRTYGFYDSKSLDVAGNEIKAKQQELFAWKTIVASSPDGTYKNPYRFALNQGENTISITISREPAVIKGLSLVAPISSISYDEYKTQLGFSEDKIVDDAFTTIEQMEVPFEKSNAGIRMEWDGNYATLPKSYEVTRYNYFGGDRWSSGGESASWKFTVPEDGWYQVGFRYQTTITDIVAYREIKIDGEIPFDAMEEYCFPYSDGWLGSPLKDGNNQPYYFYFTKGEHTITMTSKVGPLRSAVQSLDEAMESISTLVVQIASITGAIRNESGGYTVDKNRDWDLDKYIVGIQEQIEAYRDTFITIYNDMKAANNGALPYYASSVSVAKILFERLAEDLEDIPASLNDINNTLSSLSTSLSTITEQPLALDYMILTGDDYNYSKCTSTGLQNIYVASVQFFDSFTKDYNIVGSREDPDADDDSEGKEIEVYVARGREYVEMLRNLVAEEFTPQTGIKVNINMINGGVEGLVMLRYITGKAPDVAISVSAGAPVEYAARGALVALNDLNGDGVEDNPEFYELWKQSFLDDAFVLGRYRGNYYSFPETQSWTALFYRTDIISDDLELDVPNTWDEIYEMLPTLQENGMDFCYSYSVGGLFPFLYQKGAELYDYNGLVSGLDTEEAYDAFVEYADLYNKYNIPYAANFYMKFKMGDMPIGIGDMGMYCQLKYSAPEIDGKWAIAPLPGHIQEDGTLDRSNGGSGSCCIMINNKEKLQAEESWEFIKWWMSDEIQTAYAAEVEATFGVASRWNTANRNSVTQMAYSEEELAVILEQWNHFKETPVVLGGYYSTRYLTTALNQAVLQGSNARIALEDAVREINKEMKRKQEEFFPGGVDSVTWKEYREKGDDMNG